MNRMDSTGCAVRSKRGGTMRSKMLLILAVTAMVACAPLAFNAKRAERTQTPALDFSRYQFDAEKPLADRVANPPEFVLDYLKKIDERTEYAPHELSKREQAMVQKNLDFLPDGYKAILKQRLLGIYFVDNFLGSGYTEFVLDGQGRVFSFTVFNSKVLKETLSDWLTRKEMSAFAHDTDKVKITVDCGVHVSAFAWILLHEATHAADYAENFTPYVEPALWEMEDKPRRTSGFTAGVWRDYAVPATGVVWLYTGRVSFYGMGKGPGLPVSHAHEVYKALANTPFASLYATQNWAEDLAEYMAFYHLTQTMKHPYTVRVADGQNTVFEFRPFADKNSPCLKRDVPKELL